MSRPIEFRVWNKKEKYMSHGFGSNYFDGCNGQIYTKSEHMNITDRYEIMQYTGLTDKNGKKVFEGDIICQNDSSKKRYSVVEFCSHLKSASRDSPSTFNTGYYACTQGGYKLGFQEGFTVEGNVYENPELLNVNSNT